MTHWPPAFDELYAISDIHLGGQKANGVDFQIFNRGARLAGLIDLIAAQRPDDQVALVVNGDFIDSLAEDEVRGYVALDEATALAMMEHLCTDPSFVMVWDALAAFLHTPRRHLVIIVGNHDIELALPVVQADIRRRLAGADPEVLSRLTFSTQGAGLACQVGPARVFCTHGNELDPMNWIDYNQLGQLGNATTAGRSADPAQWKPNGGTRLVKDVMNLVKRNYPFIDLLKPETAAIAGVLMAIDRDTFRKVDLGDAFPILKDALRGRSVTGNLLGAEGGIGYVPPRQAADVVMQQLLGPNLRSALERGGAGMTASEDDLLLDAGAALARGARPSAQIGADGTPETLGVGDFLAGVFGVLSKPEALRRALQDWFGNDLTYDLTAATQDGDLFKAMQGRIGGAVDFTITGHTHLARALRLPRGGYYNCGTWIRLLRLTSEVLASPEAFAQQLWPALTARSMQALDTAMIPGTDGKVALLLDRTNVVRISSQGNRSVGDLLRVTGDERAQVRIDVERDTRCQPIEPITVE